MPCFRAYIFSLPSVYVEAAEQSPIRFSCAWPRRVRLVGLPLRSGGTWRPLLQCQQRRRLRGGAGSSAGRRRPGPRRMPGRGAGRRRRRSGAAAGPGRGQTPITAAPRCRRSTYRPAAAGMGGNSPAGRTRSSISAHASRRHSTQSGLPVAILARHLPPRRLSGDLPHEPFEWAMLEDHLPEPGHTNGQRKETDTASGCRQ